MFFGEFDYRIDQKGRVPVPPRFRSALKEGVVLAPGAEECITAYTMAGWDKLAAKLTGSKMSPSKLRRLSRAIFATAFSTEMDGQGRIALPTTLRDYAGIGNEVVIAGANLYLEIWSRDRWDEEKAAAQQEAWQTIEGMEDRG